MKNTFFSTIVLLLFSVSIIFGCVTTKTHKDQNVVTAKEEKITERSKTYDDIKEKLKTLNALLEDGLITKDEYYKARAELLEKEF